MTDQDARSAELLMVSRQMMQFVWPTIGTAQAVHVAARLGIADVLATEPKTADQLANATRTHAPTLCRLLRVLVRLGLLVEDGVGRFRNTDLGASLRRDHPGSIRPWVVMLAAPFFWRSWGGLYDSIVTGEPAFDRIFGMPFYEYLAEHREDADVFDSAMSAGSHSLIPAAYDFSHFQRIVDVGGGQGALLHRILSANPKLHGVLYDLPAVVAPAVDLRTGPLAARCEVVGGSFFDAVPEGADAYVLSGVIHNWNDAKALTILRNCRRAIRDDGTLLLIEMVLDSSSEPSGGIMDLMMLVLVGGRERTESDFRELLRGAGFSLVRVIPTAAHSIIESRPI